MGTTTTEIGEFRPTKGVRLTLHITGPGRAELRRDRRQGPGVAARIKHSEGTVVQFGWDEHHRTARPVWMGTTEDWARDQIERHGTKGDS